MKNNLDIAREVINDIDKEMIELFKKRMAACKMVALYKHENNLPVLDNEREQFIINKNLELLNYKELEKYYLMFLRGILKSSKDYQADIIESIGK